jgi:hypothetical protein
MNEIMTVFFADPASFSLEKQYIMIRHLPLFLELSP